jgi:hypothetical protein
VNHTQKGEKKFLNLCVPAPIFGIVDRPCCTGRMTAILHAGNVHGKEDVPPCIFRLPLNGGEKWTSKI